MMFRSAVAELRANPGRFGAVFLAIVLGVAFAAGTLVFTASVNAALGRSVAADVSKVDVVVSGSAAPLNISRIGTVPGVRHVEPALETNSDFAGPGGHGYLQLRNVPTDPAMRWYSLASGRWPANASEIAVDSGTATRRSWQVGSKITLGTSPKQSQATVVAVLDTSTSPLADSGDAGYGTLDLVRSVPGSVLDTAQVLTAPGFSDEQVAANLQSAFGPSVTVATAADVTRLAIQNLGGDTDVLTLILLAFVVLAGLVAAMVVANTFTILITQRRRSIALIRCIGATGGQVRRSALSEASLVAVAGSVAGVVVGIGVGRIACAFAGVLGSDFRVDPVSMPAVVLAGVVVTVISALAPTARAMRIPPMAALRPVDPDQRQRSVGRVRIAFGSVLLLGGGAVLGGGVYLKNLLVTMGGGAVTAVGVLLLLRVVLPRILNTLSGLGSMFGTTGKLAVANTVRNPGRAAATCTALVVGVGAIVTLLVAAASAQAGADRSVGARNPLDLQVTATGSPSILPVQLQNTLGSLEGVQAAIAVPATQVQFKGNTYTVYGPQIDQLAAVRNGGELAAGQIAVPGYLFEQYRLEAGDRVEVTRAGVTLTLSLAATPLTDDNSMVVPAPDLQRLDPAPPVRAVWAKFDAGAAPNDVMAKVNRAVAPFPGVEVSGAGPQRAATADVLGTLIKIALALLAVAVVIAIVGIGNTLGLSVVERTRESALLRALGLRRGQLRSMLALEAALLALVAAVVGSFFGVIFGFAAVGAAFGQAGEPAIFTLPYGQLTLVCAGAVLAGVLASALPGRRAAKATPVQALVEV